MRKVITPSGQTIGFGFGFWKFYTDLTQNSSAIGQDGLDSRDREEATGMGIGKEQMARRRERAALRSCFWRE